MNGSVKTKIFFVGASITLVTALGAFITKPRPVYAERVLVNAFEVDQEDVKLLADTMWGEARNQGDIGMLAVGFVALNRQNTRRGWASIEDVVKSPKQFSVWNRSDPNFKKLSQAQTTKEYRRALQLAGDLLRDRYTDPTGGATHYHAKQISPYWVKHMEQTVTIKDHIFYKELK